MQVSSLFVEYSRNPLAIDTPAPRFSWTLFAEERGQCQSAYQILVASTEEDLEADTGDMWDSGRVQSAQSTQIVYAGSSLQSNMIYYWKVRVWDSDGEPSAYSETAQFGTGLLQPDEWVAKWIGRGPAVEQRVDVINQALDVVDEEDKTIEVDGRSVLLRREFVIDKPVKRARVYVCGLGYYELSLNGTKVGDHVLAPPKTHYRERVLYDTFDVTGNLTVGANAFGIMLGNGWFNPQKKWWGWRMQWYGSPRAIMQMHVEYEDGTTQLFSSDETWKAATGPIVASCIYDGETYDANLEKPGWEEPDYDDSQWDSVNLVEPPGGELVSAMLPPSRVTETIQPVGRKQPEPGVYVFDMGQNFAGWVRVKVKGPKGTELVLRFAEDAYDDGTLDPSRNGSALATDTYIMKGDGVETYEPRFTWHGFRYVEVTGFPGEPALDAIEGCVVHSACDPVGHFECDNELINKIHRCTLWAQRSCLQGVPLDCPQRAERLGWMGDVHATAEEAMLNLDMALFYTKWLRDIQLQQDEATGDLPYIAPRPGTAERLGRSPAWSSAYLMVPWYHYLNYGDFQLLQAHYENMKRYVQFLGTLATDYILPKDVHGDWASVAEGWEFGDPELVPTAYYYYDATIVSKVAKILGKEEDANYYAELSQQIRVAFNERWFDQETNNYETGTQCCNAFPLFLGIVPEEREAAVLENLIDDIIEKNNGHLNTGILGTKYMIEMLTQRKRSDIAYMIVTQQDHPSWEYMLRNSTTLTEEWDPGKPGETHGSGNHVMFGSVDAWFYRTLAGINIDERHPGYEKTVIKPYFPDDLNYVNASVRTIRGIISSSWQRGNGSLILSVTIPVNSTAEVWLPVGTMADEIITESGHVIWDSTFRGNVPGILGGRVQDRYLVIEIASGAYQFEFKLSP